MLMTINATPRIRLRIWSSMRVNAKIAIVDTIINVSSIGHNLKQKNETDKQSVPIFLIITLIASVVDATADNIKKLRGNGLLTRLVVLQI